MHDTSGTGRWVHTPAAVSVEVGMRILILSSTLGLGHIRAAEAIGEALREADAGVEVRHLDFWSLMDARVAGAAKEAYLRAAMDRSRLYDRLYGLDGEDWMGLFGKEGLPPPLDGIVDDVLHRWFPGRNGFPARGDNLDQTLLLNACGVFGTRAPLVGGFLGRGLVLWAYALLARRLRQHIGAFDPEVVISTQMMPAGVLSSARAARDSGSPSTVAVLTDYGVQDFWLEAGLDRYFVATEEMAGRLRRRGHLDVSVTGIPLEAGFRRPPAQAEARRDLALPSEGRVVLVTGGGFGIGAAEALEALMNDGPDCRILVAAAGMSEGPNADRVRDLHRGASDRVHLFEDRTPMPHLVRAADVVVGKPGGLTVSEALACGRPFLALRFLGGQEGFNVRYLERHRVGGAVTGPELRDTLRRWLADPAELQRVQARASALGRPGSATAIARGILGGREAPALPSSQQGEG